MSRPDPKPAAGWSRMLEWAARRLGTPELADDAAELFGRHALERGERAARRWYRRQAIASLRRALFPGRAGLRRRGTAGWLAGLSLDVKLGVRMLVKSPGLTGVAVFTLALGIPTALWPFHMMNLFETPLPFHEGERIVGLRHSESDGGGREGTLHAYAVWRETLVSFEQLGAASRGGRFNVAAEEGPAALWPGAWITASSFDIAAVPPLLGRPILDSDEVLGAPDVVVLGYEPWQALFAGDAGAVGRTVRIGGTPHTVVGVMPEGFLFPERDHLWMPLRGAGAAEPGEEPEVWIYGRLADGVAEEQALAELTGVEAGLDEAFPDVYGRLRPELVSYTQLVVSLGAGGGISWRMALFQLLAIVLLGIACGNIGTLVLARNAARAGEVWVRTALGATRMRIVSQLFVESLVLALLATGVGLLITQYAIGRFQALDLWQQLPFWFDFGVDRRIALQALGIAVFCAVVAGVLPALKATGGGIRGRMRETAQGSSSVRFGGATTALIVAEVALGVMCLFGGWIGTRLAPRVDEARTEVPLASFLAARLTLPEPPAGLGEASSLEATDVRLGGVHEELMRRLAAEPGVRGVALGDRLPGQDHPVDRIEVEGRPRGDSGRGELVMSAEVVPGFFEGLGHPVRAGRDFALSDLPAAPGDPPEAVIVNTAFARRMFGGASAIGGRVRYVSSEDDEPGPWHTVVGVVGSLGMINFGDPMPDDAGIYHPMPAAELGPPQIAIHIGDDPAGFAPRLREIVADIDPAVIVEETAPLTDAMADADDRALVGWVLFAVAVVAGVSVVLSVASLYALMAFTVARRTREIGLRSALGAPPARIVSVIAKRALAQLLAGVCIAALVIAVLVRAVLPGAYGTMEGWPLMLLASMGVVLLVGMLACVAPTLRGLRIRPMDALRT